jgi:uncharacterized protein YlxW (UPF0749 family)
VIEGMKTETEYESSEQEEDDSNLALEEQVARLKEKNVNATRTIESLVAHISNYKDVVEEEKFQLENELEAER